jgi:hypothetical protein
MPSPPVSHQVVFDELGQFIDRQAFDTLLSSSGGEQKLTDVFVLSHGWKNSFADAHRLYANLLAQLADIAHVFPGPRPPDYLPLAIGVVWPSKAWDEAEASGGLADADSLPEAVDEAFSPARASPAGFRHDVYRMKQFLLADRLTIPERDEFRSLLRRHADLPAMAEDESVFEPAAPAEALEGLTVGEFSARDVFRTFTYWQMKKRSGVVGQTGVRAVIAAVQGRFPAARVHLIGHSFGCKVMLAAVAGPGEPPPRPVQTLVLLQGAVSFEAMAARVSGTGSPGGYRAAIDPARVDGPIVATYSRLDKACSQAYPLGSRVAGQVGELEALFDRYRALGAVGASGIGEELEHRLPMMAVGKPYGFGGPGVWSIDGGTPPAAFITGHSVIRSPQVAWLIWSAMGRR